MRITREADYAIRIMCLLCDSEEILDAGTIAQRSSLTQQFTLKILRKLSQGGLVRSYKGSHGGYTLESGAKDATLKQVIELIDGSLAISKCVDADGGCSLAGTNKSECLIHHLFAAVSDDLSKKLDSIKVFEVADKNANIAELVKKIRK